MKRILSMAALTLGLWAGTGISSAAALSCMAPELTRTMEDAKASEKLYYIIVGDFELVSKQEIPRRDIPPNWHGPASDFPNPVRAKMRFDGFSLSPNPNSDQALTNFRLEVETSCAAHWCGGLPPQGKNVIAFIEVRPGNLPVLRMGACPQWLYYVQPGDGKVDLLRGMF